MTMGQLYSEITKGTVKKT